MSETARLGPAGMEVQEAASPPVPFEAFFEQERDGLYRALWLVTRSRFEAEELTQEAFVRVLERWDRVSEMEDPHSYLYRTAMNAFRTSYGREMLAALDFAATFEPARNELRVRAPLARGSCP